MRLLGAIILCKALGAPEVFGQPGTETAHPAEYRSPSGTYSLSVDPHDRHGDSGAKYRFSKDSKDQWSGERPYTLREATVTDDGLVAGFAYRTGSERPLKPGEPRYSSGPQNPPEYLHIVILDAKGRELLNEVNERMKLPMSHSDLYPFVEHFLVDPENDRLIVNVQTLEKRQPGWWFYRLSSGAVQDRRNPELGKDEEQRRYVLDVRVVRGTELLLLHWLVPAPNKTGEPYGGQFTLTYDLVPVWSVDFQDDYAGIDFDQGYRFGSRYAYFEDNPAILKVDEPKRFELREFKTNQRVTYSISLDRNQCPIVEEVARKPYDESKQTTTDLQRKTSTAKYLGELKLSTSTNSSIRDVIGFTFDGQGRIHFERKNAKAPNTLVCMDQEGKIVSERPFAEREGLAQIDWAHTARVGDGRFLVSRSSSKSDGRVAGGSDIAVFSAGGELLQVASLRETGIEQGEWSPHLLSGAGELLLFEKESGTVHRYRLE